MSLRCSKGLTLVLMCFSLPLSPFPPHPSWWWRRWLSVCVRLCCVCTTLAARACLWMAFALSFCGLTLLLCVSPPLWIGLAAVCLCCTYVFACLRVALWLPLPGQYFYFQEVLPVLAAKHCIMQANAELHQSILAKQKKCFGEEIARLQVYITNVFYLFNCLTPTEESSTTSMTCH